MQRPGAGRPRNPGPQGAGLRSLRGDVQPRPPDQARGSQTRASQGRHERKEEVKETTQTMKYNADASKAKKFLSWEPKIRFHDLIKIMVDADIEEIKKSNN